MIDFFNRPQTRILLLEAVFFLFWMALNLFVPTLPVYINTFTDNLALIGITRIDEYAMRYITDNKKNVDVRGPVFLTVRSEVAG